MSQCNSVFQQPWWLDAAAPGQWEEITIQSGKEIVARLPYVRHKRRGLTILTVPPLTQTLGPWLAPLEGTYSRRLKAEMELMSELIARLPRFDLFQQSFSPLLTNILPFYWAGFEGLVRYTMRLDDLTDLDEIWNGFKGNLRTGIRQAEKQVEVRTDAEVTTLLDISAKTFRRQGLPLPFKPDTLRRIHAACSAHDAFRSFYATDDRGRVHAAVSIVWDSNAAYGVIGGRDSDIAGRGAYNRVMWEAIRFASQVTKVFDFAGSMVESIERANRAFGARHVPYFFVRKASPRMQGLLSLRELARAFGGRR